MKLPLPIWKKLSLGFFIVLKYFILKPLRDRKDAVLNSLRMGILFNNLQCEFHFFQILDWTKNLRGSDAECHWYSNWNPKGWGGVSIPHVQDHPRRVCDDPTLYIWSHRKSGKFAIYINIHLNIHIKQWALTQRTNI